MIEKYFQKGKETMSKKIWLIVLAVIIILFLFVVGGYVIEKKQAEKLIDQYIKEYGIPNSAISKSTYDYSWKNGDYVKTIWTKQDGNDIRYYFCYPGRFSGSATQNVYIEYSIYGNGAFYRLSLTTSDAGNKQKVKESLLEEARSLQLFLKKSGWKIAYPPPELR